MNNKTIVHLAQGRGVACGLWGEGGVRVWNICETTCKQCLRTIFARKIMIKRLEGDPEWEFWWTSRNDVLSQKMWAT